MLSIVYTVNTQILYPDINVHILLTLKAEECSGWGGKLSERKLSERYVPSTQPQRRVDAALEPAA